MIRRNFLKICGASIASVVLAPAKGFPAKEQTPEEKLKAQIREIAKLVQKNYDYHEKNRDTAEETFQKIRDYHEGDGASEVVTYRKNKDGEALIVDGYMGQVDENSSEYMRIVNLGLDELKGADYSSMITYKIENGELVETKEEDKHDMTSFEAQQLKEFQMAYSDLLTEILKSGFLETKGKKKESKK